MSDGKTPQTEAHALELLNASITRETVRGAVENFLGASKEAAKQDAGRAPFDELAYARLVAADPSTSANEEFDITTIRALVAEIDRLSAGPVISQNAITFESGALDTIDFWVRAANRSCEMLNKRSEQLREMAAERDSLKQVVALKDAQMEEAFAARGADAKRSDDALEMALFTRDEAMKEIAALKAREELAQTSLRLALSGMKQANEQREAMEKQLRTTEGYVRELRKGLHALRDETQLWLDDGDTFMERIDTERAKEQAQAAESRRNAAVSDAGPANDVALKVTE